MKPSLTRSSLLLAATALNLMRQNVYLKSKKCKYYSRLCAYLNFKILKTEHSVLLTHTHTSDEQTEQQQNTFKSSEMMMKCEFEYRH